MEGLVPPGCWVPLELREGQADREVRGLVTREGRQADRDEGPSRYAEILRLALGRVGIYFGVECFGRAASKRTKRLLPPGTLVRLLVDPAADRVDRYGRLLRYVIRVRDGLKLNVRLVAEGIAAPYFFNGRHGRFAARLDLLARRAKVRHLGLWGACPHTRYDPFRAVRTQTCQPSPRR